MRLLAAFVFVVAMSDTSYAHSRVFPNLSPYSDRQSCETAMVQIADAYTGQVGVTTNRLWKFNHQRCCICFNQCAEWKISVNLRRDQVTFSHILNHLRSSERFLLTPRKHSPLSHKSSK